MTEPTAPVTAADGSDPAATGEAAPPVEPRTLTVRGLLEAGAHFGHQVRRWNPKMRSYIFGQRNGIHIIDLDQSLPLLREALDFLREVTSDGGKVLLVGTKKQAAPMVMAEAVRAKQFYVNNRWLGGMLTNWKTVKKSIDRYKVLIEQMDDEEKRAEYSKKVLAGMGRQREKYRKSLEGIREMTKLPDAVVVIDVMKEAGAVSEARRLGIPIVAIVDTNCNPDGIDYVVPGNDDALRAIDYYCGLVADVCIEGAMAYNEKLQSEADAAPDPSSKTPAAGGRRVVEITQAPRRSRGASGRTASAGGWADRPEEAAPAAVVATSAPAAEPATEVAAAEGQSPAAEETKPETASE